MHDNRIALVTGANQGVGLQVARELAAGGLTVLVGSRNFERGAAAAKDIGPAAVAIQLDVTDGASIAAAAERVRKEFGRLDLLVNNAGISKTTERSLGSPEYAASSRASNASLDEIRAVWETNVFGVLAVYQAMLPLRHQDQLGLAGLYQDEPQRIRGRRVRRGWLPQGGARCAARSGRPHRHVHEMGKYDDPVVIQSRATRKRGLPGFGCMA
jgi:NAD(P)-dependent dehydrogenase (short-subunit alcohol dehydrogenase family)